MINIFAQDEIKYIRKTSLLYDSDTPNTFEKKIKCWKT